jgi:hypothetical protein
MHMKVLSTIVLATLGLAACGSSGSRVPVAAAAATTPPMASIPAPADYGAVLGSDGRCIGTAAGTATIIEPGIGECDLVRLKGKAPTDVLVGEGQGTRETQVLYSEAGARELYLFVNNRLDRVVK